MSYKKYIDLFQQRTQKKESSDSKLLADKDTYLNFLEVQLEKVSNAIINVNEVVETTKELKTQVAELTDKMNNSTKLLKLIQSFVDAQEEDNVKVHQKLRLLTSRVEVGSEEETRQLDGSKVDQLDARFNELERKMMYMLEQKDQSWKVQSPVHALSRDRDVERTLREIDGRITEQLNQTIDKQFGYMKEFEEKIQAQNEKFCRDIALDIKTLEIRNNEFMRRVEEKLGQTTRTKDLNDHRSSRAHKDEFEQKIEEIINDLGNMVTHNELEQFRDTVIREISKHQEGFERLDGRLFESQKAVSDLNRKLLQVEKMMINSDLPLTVEHLEKGDKVSGGTDLSPINRNIKDIYNRLRNLEESRGTHSKSDGIRQSYVDHSLVEEVDKRVSEKYSEQIDRISDVVKKVMKRQQELESTIELFSGRLPRVASTNETLRAKDTNFQSTQQLRSPAYESGPSMRSQQTEQTPKQKSQSKSTTPKASEGTQQIENPFLKAKFTSGDRLEIPLGPINTQTSKESSSKYSYEMLARDAQTSFGTGKHKSGNEPNWFSTPDTNELETLLSKKREMLNTLQARRSDKKSTSKSRSKKKKEKSTKKSKRSKSRSVSASASRSRSQSKTPTDNSFISKKSELSAKPATKKKKRSEGSKTPKSAVSSRGNSRSISRSRSRSGSVSPAMAKDLKRVKPRSSTNKDISPRSTKKDSLLELEQRLGTDRQKREQQIKKLVKKTKLSPVSKTKKTSSKTAGLIGNKENKDQNVRKLSTKKY